MRYTNSVTENHFNTVPRTTILSKRASGGCIFYFKEVDAANCLEPNHALHGSEKPASTFPQMIIGEKKCLI